MNEQEKKYSLYKVEFHCDSLDECIKNYIGEGYGIEFPFELKIYIGDKIQFKPHHFLPDMDGFINDQVNDECGEWSESWQNSIISKSKKLQSDFEDFFDKWCDENDCKVDFFNVENVKEVTYIVKSKDDYEVKK